MIALKVITMLAIAATAGFFLLYLAAIELDVRKDRREGLKPFLDDTGGAIILGARSAFAVCITLLVVWSICEIAG